MESGPSPLISTAPRPHPARLAPATYPVRGFIGARYGGMGGNGHLNNLALERGQTLAQMAIAWLLKDSRVTSVLVGASSIGQLQNSIDALNAPAFSADELQKIELILSQ